MKDVKVLRCDNLRRSLWSRSAALILPGTLSLFALGGVTVRPALDVSRAREQLAQSHLRAEEWRVEHDKNERLRSERTFEVATEVLSRARKLVPAECSNVVAHGIVRAVAERLGVELERLHVGNERDVGLPQTTDRIAAREVSLTGRARPSQVVQIVGELRALGFPTSVESLTLRRDLGEADFEFHLELGLLHYSAPAPVSVSVEAPQDPP